MERTQTVHRCRHPRWHMLAMLGGVGSWVLGAMWWGMPWVTGLSRHFGPGWNLMTYALFSIGWMILVVPLGVGALWALIQGRCVRERPCMSKRQPPRVVVVYPLWPGYRRWYW